jgi:cytochrome c-type biogenesis protein CcmH
VTTIVFWLFLTVMTVLALSFFLLPLLRGRADAEVTRRDANIAMYRERIQEVEQAVASGGYAQEDANAIKQELDRRLVSEVDVTPDPVLPASIGVRSRHVMALLLLVALPALAISVYLGNSDWQLALASDGPQAVQLLLERLERHLENEPKDSDAWFLLAKSRADLKQYDAAAKAYAQLNVLSPSAETLVAEAEARGMANDGNLQGRPASLIEQALRTEPNHARGLWYAGLMARQRGDDDKAVRYWNQLAGQPLPDDFRMFLNAQITQAGGKPTPVPEGFRLVLQVSLSPSLARQVPAETPVFIYARAKDAKGPPLAVIRRQFSELPLTIQLDDSLSMLPDRKLSSVDQWAVTARVALQGTAETQSGDLIVEEHVTREQLGKAINLVIDRVVP